MTIRTTFNSHKLESRKDLNVNNVLILNFCYTTKTKAAWVFNQDFTYNVINQFETVIRKNSNRKIIIDTTMTSLSGNIADNMDPFKLIEIYTSNWSE